MSFSAEVKEELSKLNIFNNSAPFFKNTTPHPSTEQQIIIK